ncbi:MAG: type VI secretion system baseplate subunit TssF [Pseudomonadota bacterium]|nr:type VI secretion system baseplate subunit TssF [Pseudomonadota bacterium]
MDPRLLRYYNQELRYLREMGGEFAREFPKIASRLGMDSLEVSDPYVERLLEGCAFLAARVQLKQDAEFPRLSQRLLELLYPGLLAPLPSMMVVLVKPMRVDPNLIKAPRIARDTPLFAAPPSHTRTRCEYRTAQTLQLTPLETESAEYFRNVADLGLSSFALPERPRAGVRVRLRLPEGVALTTLETDDLRFFIGGQPDVAKRLHELLATALLGVLVGTPGRPETRRLIAAEQLQPVGFEDADAMLPQQLRMMSGLRLLQEYFAFPQRFLFFDLAGLQTVLSGLAGSSLELLFLFSRPGLDLDGLIEAANFSLHCVPAINLFAKRADRIELDDGSHEFHVVPERTAPLDYEVYDVLSASGFDDQGQERVFLPLFAPDHSPSTQLPAYYSIWREPRLLSEQSRREGPRSGYIGSEVFVSLVDTEDTPIAHTLRQLSVQTRCTNRDLPLFFATAGVASQFTLEAGVPVQGVQAVAGPSRPYSALREGGVAWRMINLLALNYLSLLDSGGGDGALALRDLLSRLPMAAEPVQRRMIDSIQKVSARPVVRRHPIAGPIAFSRGLRIELTMDELGHEGGSAVLFASVLHQFFSRHASINSHVETVLFSLTRGELMRWRPKLGARPAG